jgi:hypothetical protein
MYSAGRMAVIGSIPFRKDVSCRQCHTGRRSVKSSNPEEKMSVIGSTLYNKDVSYKLIGITLQEGCQL